MRKRRGKAGSVNYSERHLIGLIAVEVTYKAVTRWSLHVKPGGIVTMSVPLGTSQQTIAKALRANYAWLCRQLAKRETHRTPPIQPDSHSLCLWGNVLPVRQERGLRLQTSLGTNAITVASPQTLSEAQMQKILHGLVLCQLQTEVESLWEPCQKMVGVRASSYHWRDMRSRWGSCNTGTGRICLNIQLIRFPRLCLRSVLIHELVHLLVKPHNREFYAYMDTFCPPWREVRKILNER